MNFKGLFLGIILIILIGIAGFLYRSYAERPTGPVACTADAKVCPDGTGLGRSGPSCEFPACPPPNIELAAAGIAFVLPEGYTATAAPDANTAAAFVKIDPQTKLESYLYIRSFVLASSTTAADFIRGNAIMDASGAPAPATAFTATTIGGRLFSLVTLGRFEGVVDTVYYRDNGSKIFRFDAQSRNVTNWTDPALNVMTLPANQDMRALLGTLQGN